MSFNEDDKVRFFTENMQECVVIYKDGLVTYINEAGQRMIGYRLGEVVGKPCLDFIADGDKDAAMQRLAARAAGCKDRFTYEITFVRKDGAPVPVEIASHPLVDDGQIQGVLVIAKDLTERRDLRNAVSDLERQFQAIANHVQDGVFKLERNKIVYANDRLLEIFGYTLEEFAGVPFEHFLAPGDTSKVVDDVQQLFRGEHGHGSVSAWITCKDGQRKFVEMHATTFSSTSTGTAVYGTVKDATWKIRVDEFFKVQLDLAYKLGSTADLGSILDFSLDAAMELGAMDCGGIYLVKRNGDVQLAKHKGLSDEFVQQNKYYPAGSRHAVIIDDGMAYARAPDGDTLLDKVLLDEGLTCIVVIPIIHEGKPVGSINLGSHELSDLPAESQNLLHVTCAHVGSAIARAKAESYYHLLADTAKDIIIIHDLDGMIEFANDVALKVTGCSREELLTKNVMAFVSPGFRDVMNENKAHRLGGDFTLNVFRLDMVAKGGKIVPLEMSSSPIVQDGKLQGILVIGRDITTRLKEEAHLREMETKYRFIVEHADDLITIVNERQEIEMINEDTHRRVLGYEPDEVMGKNPTAFVHPDDVDNVIRGYADTKTTGSTRADFRLLKKDTGEVVYFDAIGKLIGPKMMSIARNVTAAREIAALQAQEIERLTQLDRMKTSFVSNATHELKTPLASVAGAAKFLQEHFMDQVPESAGRMIDLVARGSYRLQDLVNKILDFSRLERGKITLDVSNIDAVDIVTEAARDMEYLAKRRSILLSTDVPATIPFRGDASRVLQVVVNLVSNAIKNTRPGGHAWLRAIPRGENVVFTITDDGIGITPDEMKVLFMEFGKIERDHEDIDIQGTGLGLYIARGIAELHGGTLHAESPGRNAGATFVAMFPLRGPAGDGAPPAEGRTTGAR